MNDKNTDNKSIYGCIVIGAGASGLFYAAAESMRDDRTGRKLILDKTGRPGQKLLMSGNGMCNITHAGSIKDFISRYGDKGRLIRGCLYRHNNLELRDMMLELGVSTIERPDGKVFPESMKSSDVLSALLNEAGRGGWEIRCGAEVTGIAAAADPSGDTAASDCAVVTLADGTALYTRKLVIATGGASYPSTGSDGTFLSVIKRDLGLNTTELRPALAPVFVQDFRYGELAGVSFDNVTITAGKHVSEGPMLITHRGFSGPAVLHISQYVKPGDELRINYLPGQSFDDVSEKIKSDQPGCRTGAANYIASEFSLPKAFVCAVLADLAEREDTQDKINKHSMISAEGRISSLTGPEIKMISGALTGRIYSASGTGGFNEAMVTAGGVALDQIDLKTMQVRCRDIPCDIRIIGETLDINGDTGGYNLQFAYSSAMAALDDRT